MNQEISTLISLLLIIISAILACYNLLYAYRVKSAREKIGIDLPGVISKLFILTTFLSFVLMAISVIIFILSLFSL